jgi:hypothetical protein
MGDIEKITQWVQLSSALGPEGQMAPRMGAISDYVADKLGVRAELRSSPQEREQMMQQAAQAAQRMAQQQGMAPAEGGAEAIPEGM